jgi:hypothetical protein
MQQLWHRLLHAIITDPLSRNHVLDLLRHFLLGDRRHIKSHHFFLVIGVTILDDALGSLHLQLYLH